MCIIHVHVSFIPNLAVSLPSVVSFPDLNLCSLVPRPSHTHRCHNYYNATRPNPPPLPCEGLGTRLGAPMVQFGA